MESKPNLKYANLVAWETEEGGLHRMDGPAVIWNDDFDLSNERHRHQWWINNLPVTVFIEPWAEEMGIDLKNLTEDDKLLIQIKWGEYGK